MGLQLTYPVKLPKEEVLTDVPSSRAVAVHLAPPEGQSPVVRVVESATGQFPRHLREQLCASLEHDLFLQIDEVMEGSAYHGKRHSSTLVMFKFAPGTKVHVALKSVRRAVAWFFSNLAPSAHRRTARQLKKLQKKERRRERHAHRGLNRRRILLVS